MRFCSHADTAHTYSIADPYAHPDRHANAHPNRYTDAHAGAHVVSAGVFAKGGSVLRSGIFIQ